LLRRLRLRGRLVAGVVVLGLFGTLTRWEPSVLRAVAMATISLVAATLGRPATTLRLLALAVGALLLVDPLLVHAVRFRLPVVANLSALPAAGPLMVWGLAAGLPAGIVGGPLATALHVPTRTLISWVSAVARVSAALPLGELGMGHVLAAVAAAVLAVVGRRHGRRMLSRAAVAACVVAVLRSEER